MEFSFKSYYFLQQIDANPQYMVMWAAFGVPLLMFALALPFFIFRKVGLEKFSKPLSTIVYSTLGITWITGFITMMILLFTEVTGIRMFLVWSLMFLTYLLFCIFYYRPLQKGVMHISKKKTV